MGLTILVKVKSIFIDFTDHKTTRCKVEELNGMF